MILNQGIHFFGEKLSYYDSRNHPSMAKISIPFDATNIFFI